jgi:cytidine deaminase
MVTTEALIRRARECTIPAQRLVAGKPPWWQWMGYVGSAVMTDKANIYTGINLSMLCGIGFCAEHSAIAAMLKDGETRIAKIVAVTAIGDIIPPCGRCRELVYQIDPANLDTEVILATDRPVPLRELLPENWQQYFKPAVV